MKWVIIVGLIIRRSEKDQVVLNSSEANMWYGLYNIAKTESLNLHMIWGSQYDQIIKFIGADAQTASQSRQSTSYANSGANVNDKMKNIYDLESNYMEWTLEASGDSGRVHRGGYSGSAKWGDFYPASGRGYDLPDSSLDLYSTRLTLYL